MTLSVLIVDDEPLARQRLQRMLRGEPDLELLPPCADGRSAVAAIGEHQPDLMFLDVQMPGMSGFDVLAAVGAKHMPVVVFVTAHDRFALQAFEAEALDYLLKPFGAERLERTLDRVRAVLGEPAPASAFERFRESSRGGPISRLFVRSGRAIIPVAVDSVSWFASDGDYVAVHVGRTRHLIHLALSRLESRLDPAKFIRIHRTAIVNLDHVKAFKRDDAGQFVAEMMDGTRLDVSRSKARELRELGE